MLRSAGSRAAMTPATAEPTTDGGPGQPEHADAVQAVAERLGTDVVLGLTAASAADRLVACGPNELDDPAQRGWAVLLRAQLTSPMIALLAAAGVVSAALGDTTEALVILAVVVLNAWIGFRQEYRAQVALASLEDLARPVALVVRDASAQEVPARDLVPGDLVRLEAGSRVPADGRLVEAHALRVQESALTGESVPVDKGVRAVPVGTALAERTSMAYAGTNVTAGRGTVLVTATGMAGELGRIAGLLQQAEPGRTPLQRRLDALVRRLAVLVGVVVAVVTVVGALQGEPLDRLLLTAVSLAIAAVPESLPAVVTITLALGAQRMLRRHALVRHLYAVETLGSVTTICSDKTGTLTRNEMVVVALETADDDVALTADSSPGDLSSAALHLLVVAGVLNNDTRFDGVGAPSGDPTETALVEAGRRLGVDKRALDAAFPRVGELPFDADRKRMTTFHATPAVGDAPLSALSEAFGAACGRTAFTKGALDGLLAVCDTVLTTQGPVPLDAERTAAARATGDRLAARGLRVLGFAARTWSDPVTAQEDLTSESALMLLGVQGMIDPPREEVAAAVATCRSAGVRPVMITGDHPLTALAVARSLGIAGESDQVVTGATLSGLDDDELVAVAREAAVYARVSPEDKLRVVEAMQRDGGVVSMTGDGVNDAPALEQADIGVAMGITGTDVTKDVADVVLQDDDFSTIVSAVREGRVVFDNIRKFIRNILSGNLAEVAVMLLGPLLGMPLPLLPLQILWLNLATDGLPAIALAVEAAEPDVMRRPPTPLGESLFGADRGRRVLLRGAVLTVLTLVPSYLLWRAHDPAWQTVLFTSIAFAELAGCFAMRSEVRSLRHLGLLGNRALLAAVALTVALQVLLVSVPPVRDLLGLTALAPRHWALASGVALAYLAAIEVDKALQRGPTQRP
ncbi:MAG: ATPase, P-type (transporting), superfamily, subfamily [Frankiales bacterium]|nr:ATPase, P-type (transporting), superfamily, subfamily [Frankiales bacterium]